MNENKNEEQKAEPESKPEAEAQEMSPVLCIGMGLFIVFTAVIALMLAAPFDDLNIKAEFPEASEGYNFLLFFGIVIAFTAFILVVLRFGGKKVVHFIMIGAVAITVYYVMLVPVRYGYLPLVIAIFITIFIAILLYKYPEWYVIDAVGLIIGGGAAAIFGISLRIVEILPLLAILAMYDAIAVYKTKHMVSLAESIVDLRIPVLFVLPRKRNFSLLREKGQDKDKGKSEMEEAFFMGLGDAIIPSMLVVSANCMPAFTYFLGLINAPALGALIGTLAGYAVLSRIAGRGKPHAGLPFLNSGAIIGFLVGYFAFI